MWSPPSHVVSITLIVISDFTKFSVTFSDILIFGTSWHHHYSCFFEAVSRIYSISYRQSQVSTLCIPSIHIPIPSVLNPNCLNPKAPNPKTPNTNLAPNDLLQQMATADVFCESVGESNYYLNGSLVEERGDSDISVLSTTSKLIIFISLFPIGYRSKQTQTQFCRGIKLWHHRTMPHAILLQQREGM